jgi:DMSO/TMAO reductase YedYZ molybdopterin-dependent catalytic subunit
MRLFPLLLGILFLSASWTSSAHERTRPDKPDSPVRSINPELILSAKAPVQIDTLILSGLERRRVTAAAHDQPSALWEGVALVDVLRQAGVPLDKQLRGRELAKTVRVTAADGYQVVFGLAELDAAFSDTIVLLVDMQDGHALGAEGPFRLIVPNDKRPARWVRNVVRIELIDMATPTSEH